MRMIMMIKLLAFITGSSAAPAPTPSRLVPDQFILLPDADDEARLRKFETVSSSDDTSKLPEGMWSIVAPRAIGSGCAAGSFAEQKKRGADCALTMTTYRTKEPETVLAVLLGWRGKEASLRRALPSLLAVQPDFKTVRTGHHPPLQGYRLEPVADGDKALAAHLRDSFQRGGLTVTAAPVRSTAEADAGTVHYQRPQQLQDGNGRAATVVELNTCAGRVGAYSGAYLVTREHLLKIDFTIMQHLEGICMNAFGASDYGFKVSDFKDFYINHLSEWEHWHKRQRGSNPTSREGDLSRLVANECAVMLRQHGGSSAAPVTAAVPGGLAAVPFWGGTAAESGGNSHSEASRAGKLAQVAGTVCSAMRYFGRAAVGVCRVEDAHALKRWFTERTPPPPSPPLSGSSSTSSHPTIELFRPLHRMSYGNLPNQTARFDAHQKFLAKRNVLIPLDDHDKDVDSPPGDHPIRKKHKSSSSSSSSSSDASYYNYEHLFGVLPPVPSISIIEFDCVKGVHLPYQTMGTLQSLLRPDGGWDVSSPAYRRRKSNNGGGSASRSGSGLVGSAGAAIVKSMREMATLVPVDFVFYTEADHVTSFRNADAARAITSALLHPPDREAYRRQRRVAAASAFANESADLLVHAPPAPFPASHKSRRSLGKKKKAQGEVNKVVMARLEAAMSAGRTKEDLMAEDQRSGEVVAVGRRRKKVKKEERGGGAVEEEEGSLTMISDDFDDDHVANGETPMAKKEEGKDEDEDEDEDGVGERVTIGKVKKLLDFLRHGKAESEKTKENHEREKKRENEKREPRARRKPKERKASVKSHERDIYYAVPQRIAMRFGEPHFAILQKQREFSRGLRVFESAGGEAEEEEAQEQTQRQQRSSGGNGAGAGMTVTDAVRLMEKQKGPIGFKALTLTNACVACPDTVCPPMSMIKHEALIQKQLDKRRKEKRANRRGRNEATGGRG